MSAIATRPSLTADELAAMPESKDYELVDGNLVERIVGTESNWVAGELFGRLRDHCRPLSLGWVFVPDNGFQCFADHPNRVRKPDVSFVRAGRIPGEQLPGKGYLKLAPDLAVEVLSPNDLASQVDAKVKDYLNAGVRLVWIINPETREARIHRADRTIAELREDDELDGEDVLPGFRCRLGDLFPPPPQPAP